MLPCKEEPGLSYQIEDLPFMSTTEMYLCCWNQPPLSPLRETSPKKEEEVASEWTPHVVHDMLIVCKRDLYLFHHFNPSNVPSAQSLNNLIPASLPLSSFMERKSHRASGRGPVLYSPRGELHLKC